MAAYAALVSLMNNIHQIMKHPRFSTSLDKNQIQPLVEKAGFLLDFLEENNYGGGSKEAEDLERQIASAAHAAEDVIESHVVDQIHAGASLKCLLDLQQIIEDVDGVMEKAAELKDKRVSREEQPTHAAAGPGPGPLIESEADTCMVGLDEELLQLLDELTGRQSSRHIISIVGMGGMGKTTLAKNVYQNLLIREHFQFRAWATVSEQYDAEKVLSQLLSGLGKSASGTVDSLGEQLHKTLMGRRYLIVLDDLWSVGAWDRVRRFFPDNGNRSRVVLTTRMSNVAKDCGSSIFTMNLLDEGRSWNLFCEKVFQHGDCPPQLEEIGKEIVESCKGLALSIVVIGGLLLKAPTTVRYWEDVVRDLKSIPNSKEKQQSLEVLALSYNRLPPHLKPCFLYMGVFEEDAQIRVSNIIKLWVAEGFIKASGGRVLEAIAEGYLKDLIDRNLILVGRLRDNGRIGSCSIHDLLRDVCLNVGVQQELFHVSKYDQVGASVRRLVCTYYLRGMRPPLARSIIMRVPAHHTEPMKYRLARVLVKPRCDSPEELYANVNLRYLAYNQPYDYTQLVWELPSSVSLLWNLQTLIIKKESYSSPMVVAPIEIWNASQLRHLECYSKVYLPDPLPCNDSLILDNLQTLKVAVNLRLSEVVCKIIPNIIKLHLDYDAALQGYDDSLTECLCNLNRLDKLESLSMKIKGSKWPTPDSELNKKLTFPSSLNKLSLEYCQLHWDDLTIIGSLPRLEVLELGIHSLRGDRWSPVTEQFRRLKFLKISRCDLVYWDADDSHFPVLEKLVLEKVYFLKEIPLDVGEIPTLELIRIDVCSESAAVSALKIKEDRLENDGKDDGLQVQLRIYGSDMESLRKMVETEGLTMDNIHLEIQ